MVAYTYLLQERKHMRSAPNRIMQFDLWIVSEYDSGEPTLQAVIDWQDGLTIWQTEGIEPSDWVNIAEQIALALKDARQQMGDNAIWTV